MLYKPTIITKLISGKYGPRGEMNYAIKGVSIPGFSRSYFTLVAFLGGENYHSNKKAPDMSGALNLIIK